MKFGFKRLLILCLLFFVPALSANPVTDFLFGKDISGTYISENKSTWGSPCYVIRIDCKTGRWSGVSNNFFGEHRFPGFVLLPSGFSLKGNILELQTALVDCGRGQSYIFKVDDGRIYSEKFGTLRKQ